MNYSDLIASTQAKTYLAAVVLYAIILYWQYPALCSHLSLVHLIVSLCVIVAVLFAIRALNDKNTNWSWALVAVIVCGQLYTLHNINQLKSLLHMQHGGPVPVLQQAPASPTSSQ